MIKINNKQKALMLSFVLAAMLLPTTLRAQAYDKEAAESYNGGAFYELIAYDTYLDELANVLKAVELNRSSASISGGSITNDDFGPSPLGSGLGILLAAGAGYAVVRRKRSRKNTTLLLACLLLLGFTQCKKEQPQGSDTEAKTVGITLKVGGNSGSKHTINTTTGAVGFEEHDLIYVGNDGKYIGTLECNNSGVFTGDINEPVDNTEMYFYFVGGLTPSTTPSAGSTSSFTVDISDQSSQMPVLSCNHVTYHTGTDSYSCVLQNRCALVQFTNLSTSAPVHVGGLYTEALIDFENNCITNNGTTGFINLKSESKTAKWAVLLPQTSFVGVEGVVADYGYNITMPAAIEADAFLTGENAVRFGSTSSHNKYLQWAITGTTLENGDHVYGTLAGNYKVSVAADATVTLSGVTINGVNNSSYQWAGLNCLGNATIILADGTTNTVKGFHEYYPGIHIPSGNTLTIQGKGMLNVSSNGMGAAIGGGWNIDCGNVIIKGGNITATGGYYAAGIGAGYDHSCGTITINGGTITANGGSRGAGIGCTFSNGTCGNIAISGGTVTATGGGYAAGIGGGGYNGNCNNITISGGVVTATGGSVGSGYGGTAGIGGGFSSSCSDITISGGIVTAHGGNEGVGIGGGANDPCGDITISGGTVEATGGYYSAGIGAGYYSTNGNITIENTVTRVTATKGTNAYNCIGISCQNRGTCGTVTIGGVVGTVSTSPFVYETGALWGQFTINGSGGKVRFSQGNLQATYDGSSWSWAFATNQWDYIGNAAGNTSINGNGTVSTNNVTVDLFGWVGASSTWTGAAQYGISNSTATYNTNGYGNVRDETLKSDWGNTIGSGWRTLTSDEWTYLFNTRTSGSTVNGTSDARYTHATINTDGTGVNGMILFPDGVTIANSEATSWGTINGNSAWGTQCTTAQWSVLAAKGCVFLPAAGWRRELTVSDAGSNSSYWSSSSLASNVHYAYRVKFSSDDLGPAIEGTRCLGYSVRLVRDAN